MKPPRFPNGLSKNPFRPTFPPNKYETSKVTKYWSRHEKCDSKFDNKAHEMFTTVHGQSENERTIIQSWTRQSGTCLSELPCYTSETHCVWEKTAFRAPAVPQKRSSCETSFKKQTSNADGHQTLPPPGTKSAIFTFLIFTFFLFPFFTFLIVSFLISLLFFNFLFGSVQIFPSLIFHFLLCTF